LSAASTSRRTDARSRPARVAERRPARSGRRRPRRLLRPAVVLPLAVAAVGAGAWLAANSSIFDARHIQVSGGGHLSRAQVVAAAGVGPATNLLWVDTSAIEAAVERNPWVASATVTRSLPSTIRIAVRERHPASTVAVGSTWFLVASDGTVLGPAQHRPNLPVLPSTEVVRVGARNPGLADAALVAGGMSPWLRSRVATVAPGTDGIVQLGLDDGIRVLFGMPTDVRAKNQAIAGILQWAKERHRHLATIDVRSPVAPSAVPFDATVQTTATGTSAAAYGAGPAAR